METRTAGEPAPMKHRTTSARTSARELVVTRTINGPARLVFEAWTRADLFRQWWVPKSLGMKLLSCELDVRPGGRYKLVFEFGDSEMAFFGRYMEVTPPSRLVWTNEEGGEDGQVTTVTFKEEAGRTLVVLTELYPSKEALDAAIASGSTSGDMNEPFDQLEELVGTLK